MNEQTGNPIFTAVLVFVAGLATVVVAMAVQPRSRAAFRRIPALLRAGDLRRWQLLGGISGATFVSLQSGLVAATGVAVFTVAAVAGQTAGALLVDKSGIGPSGRHPVTVRRVFAAFMGVGGVVVSVSGADTGTVALAAVIGTLAAGKEADFIVLNANPLENIRNTREIASIYQHGGKIDRDAMLANWKKINAPQ